MRSVEAAACQIVNQSRPPVPVGSESPPPAREAALEDGSERVGEEERDEGGRNEHRGDAPGARHRRTVCVHSSIQRSRFAPISAAGSSSGAGGETA